MSIVRDFAEGFAFGAAVCEAVTRNSSNLVERLCAELGWSIDERNGNILYLHFSGSSGIRKVRITDANSSVVTFSADSHAAVPTRNLSSEALAYLLHHNANGEGVGSWGMFVGDNNYVTFHVTYSALAAGLDAQALKFIAENLAADASAVDSKLRHFGMLR